MPTEPTRILVVDDLPEKLLVYRTILDEPGTEVVAARSGPEALAALLKHEFAVILLDVNMPDMDGFETASLIRARKKCAHTPIIFVTAHSDEVHLMRGYATGAVDYILTPVVPEILRTKVSVFVQLFRLQQQVLAQAAERVELAEREQQRLASVLDRATDFVARVDAHGQILHVNRAGRLMLGYDEGQDMPRVFGAMHAEWAAPMVVERGLPTAQREGVWFGETALLTRTGEEIPVSQVISAHHAPDGKLEHFSIVARDISERRRVEAELARHRARLEELVRERTAELEDSHQKLRLADRLASIGTLAAGLGHDMGNLLLPVRMRLDALAGAELPDAAREDLAAIGSACEYLTRLSQGLRLFALNPEDARASEDHTMLESWWVDVGPFMRNAVPANVELSAAIGDGLPALAMSPHVVTQVVYNLVRNAGDSLKGRPGQVRVEASLSPGGESVLLAVIDNGDGMDEEVRRRCLEPFFTTKTRSISTGLGLTLVCGALHSVGGTIEIQSAPGKGTTFRLTIPSLHADAPQPGDDAGRALVAHAEIADARLRAYVISLLRSMGFAVVEDGRLEESNAELAVLEDGRRAASFLQADPARRAVLLAEPRNGLAAVHAKQAVFLGSNPGAADIRAALKRVSNRTLTDEAEVVHA